MGDPHDQHLRDCQPADTPNLCASSLTHLLSRGDFSPLTHSLASQRWFTKLRCGRPLPQAASVERSQRNASMRRARRARRSGTQSRRTSCRQCVASILGPCCMESCRSCANARVFLPYTIWPDWGGLSGCGRQRAARRRSSASRAPRSRSVPSCTHACAVLGAALAMSADFFGDAGRPGAVACVGDWKNRTKAISISERGPALGNGGGAAPRLPTQRAVARVYSGHFLRVWVSGCTANPRFLQTGTNRKT